MTLQLLVKFVGGEELQGDFMPQNKKDIPLTAKFVILFLLIGGIILLIIPSINKPLGSHTNDKHIISKDTFDGNWALTVNRAEIFCTPANDNMNGAKVVINNKEYSITKNLTNIPFLPYSMWKNAQFETINNKKVCTDTLIDKNTCKVSLYDLVKYAETLCK